MSPIPAVETKVSTENNQLLSDELIAKYRKDDIKEQKRYHDSCQDALQHISNVKRLVEDLKTTDTVHYPSTEESKIFQIKQELLDSSEKQLNTHLSTCVDHLDNLTTRVSDTSSKVLVTGDLNSGKSTLVNALLKKEVLPVDQQPCTSLFCEVVSTDAYDSTVVHAIKEIPDYQTSNTETFHPVEPRHLYKLLTEEEQPYKMLKIYSPRDKDAMTQHSLLHNGVIDVALIDSPGLNTDSVKTTAVFAREEEIDVVVFVVSAENHFTLSGKEFLWNATNEKTHIFIVVNRFDSIRDKERCKRLILEQIKQLSPATYENSDNFVHFVSAGHQVDAPEFVKLEQKLRSFVLNNRVQSKLVPVNNYLSNVLHDVYSIVTVNESKSAEKLDACIQYLETDFLPGYSSLIDVRKVLQGDLESMKKQAIQNIEENTTESLEKCTKDEELDATIHKVQYPGLFMTWQYAQDITDALSSALEDDLENVEEAASEEALTCLKEMNSITLEKLKDCSIEDITTKIQKSTLSSARNYRPIRVKMQARDMLLNRRFLDDKKVALSGLGTVGATVVLFKMINFKDIVLNIASRYLNPLDDSTSLPSTRSIAIALTTVGLVGAGWTVYSFVSVIPQAVRVNLKQKFQTAVKNENLIHHQTHRITQGAEHVLEAKKTEILYRLKEVIAEKEGEKDTLEQNVFKKKATLNHFKSLVNESNSLLLKVQESLVVMAPSAPSTT